MSFLLVFDLAKYLPYNTFTMSFLTNSTTICTILEYNTDRINKAQKKCLVSHNTLQVFRVGK